MKKKKNTRGIYFSLLYIGIIAMVWFATASILKAYTDVNLTGWIARKTQIKLVVSSLYTIGMITLSEKWK